MSNGDSLRKRGETLENQFFAKEDALLLENLKSQLGEVSTAAEITRVSGIKDPKIVDAIEKLGVSATSIAALRLFPLVAVAWADGVLEKSEIEKIEEVVSKHAIEKGSPAMRLLRHWLERKPSDEFLAAWTTYAKGLVNALSDEDASALRHSLLEEIKEVAQASGGLLGWGAISKGEHKVMNQVSASLTK